MPTNSPTADALVARLRGRDRAVEVGVGRRPDVAAAIAAAGVDVTAVDRRAVPVPDGVAFARDDVFDRAAVVADDPGPYAGADAVYARRLPPELHRPTLTVARAVDADLLFTTLGGDPTAVPVTPETVPGGTLYHAATDGPVRPP